MSKTDDRGKRDVGTPAGDQQVARPIYTPKELAKCREHLKLKDPESWPEVVGQIEDLGFGLRQALMKQGQQELREGIRPLEDLGEVAEALRKAFARVQRIQEKNGMVRQVLPNRKDYTDRCNSVDWDEAEDAVNVVAELGVNAAKAAARIRKDLGTSSRKNDPVLAWAVQMFLLYRAHDKGGSKGTRGTEGPFARFLFAAAEPLSVEVTWSTVHKRIKADVGVKAPTSPPKSRSSIPE